MDREVQRHMIASLIMTTSEVAVLLGISRQHVSRLVKNGRLPAMKQTDNGAIFMVEDVQDYINNRIARNTITPRSIIGGGNSRIALDYCAANIDANAVTSIKVYYDDRDAARDGYYTTDITPSPNQLYRRISPTCVITLDTDQEVWISGFRAGYGGRSVQYAAKMCTMFGIDENKAEQLYKSKIVWFSKEEEGWVTAYIDDVGYQPHDNTDGTYMYEFYYNDHKVYIPSWRGDNINAHNDIGRLAQCCRRYMPEIAKIVLMSKDEAIKKNRIISMYRYNELSQIGLIGTDGNEIWLNFELGMPAAYCIEEILAEYNYDSNKIAQTTKKLTKKLKQEVLYIPI